MTQRSSITSATPYSALTTIAVVAALVVSSTLGVAMVGTVAAQSEPDTYTISQGDQCTTVEPLGNGHLTVEEFYDYRTPNTSPSSYSYSSHGTTHLQEDDTSSLFLYEGGDGLSLVVLHDRNGGNSGGGAATMTFTNLPEDGLDMDKPVVIQSGSCTSHTVTDLSLDETASPGESTTIEATVKNDGGVTENVTVPFTVDGETVDEQEVTLEPGETVTLSTTTTFDEAGTYTIGAADETKDVTVGNGDGLPGFGVTAVAVAALLGTLVVYRRL